MDSDDYDEGEFVGCVIGMLAIWPSSLMIRNRRIKKGSPLARRMLVKYTVPEPLWPLTRNVRSTFPCGMLITPSTHGSPLRYQTGSGRIASPNNSLTSGLSLRFWRICCVMELVNLSWLFAYFMNATQAATPNVPRITNAGHLRSTAGSSRFGAGLA